MVLLDRPALPLICEEVRSRNFRMAFTTALVSGVLGALLFRYDEQYKSENDDKSFLQEYLPEIMVYNGFIIFASLAASFRTSHALRRYVDAASFVQKMRACWVDVATTLVTYSRLAPPEAKGGVDDFQHKMIRLLSLLNAICLEVLANNSRVITRALCGDCCCMSDSKPFFNFPVLGVEDLNESFQRGLDAAPCKPEYIVQTLECIIMEATSDSVMPVEPPLLTIPLSELGEGYEVYNEAKKLAEVPFPWSYTFFTYSVLIVNCAFTPCMLAVSCKGTASTFIFTFGGCFLMWFVNAVADSLNNPYQKGARLMHAGEMQQELNRMLVQIMERGNAKVPAVDLRQHESIGKHMDKKNRTSLRTFKTELKHGMRERLQEITGLRSSSKSTTRTSKLSSESQGSSHSGSQDGKKRVSAV